MTGKPRNHYTEEYKASAVSRVEKGETVSAVSKDLGIGYQTLWTWCQERGVSVRQKRQRPYKKHERCPMCGSSKNNWRKDKLGLTDLNAMEPDRSKPVHYTPVETITEYMGDEEWWRYDPYSAEWECSGCGYELRGDDDGGWFNPYSGECAAKFCPNCGHPIEQDPDVLRVSWYEG